MYKIYITDSNILEDNQKISYDIFLQANFVANLFEDRSHCLIEEKHHATDYETGAGTQVNNGSTNRNC